MIGCTQKRERKKRGLKTDTLSLPLSLSLSLSLSICPPTARSSRLFRRARTAVATSLQRIYQPFGTWLRSFDARTRSLAFPLSYTRIYARTHSRAKELASTMAATHGEYRGYLRNTVDMEAGQGRFHSVPPSSESTYRPLLFGTLAVMGLLQVASSVAILLHLTGYLQEVRKSP